MSPSPPLTALLVLGLLVFVAVVCKETTHASALDASTTTGVSPQKMKRIQRFLEKINKPAVKSIKSPDGDIIDCVLMEKQLAFDHSLLKNHKIQKVAPQRPGSRSDAAGNQQPGNIGTTRRALQAWNILDDCPDGTVPVQRTTVEDVLRAGSLSRFGKKQLAAMKEKHEYATAKADRQQAYGTKVIIDVWNPFVEQTCEFSLSQLWVTAGSYKNNDLNTIEVGWQILPCLYGDNKTRLFIFWTSDAYATGCYNLKCPGFVQTNKQVVIGGTIDPVSMYDGQQTEKTFYVWKDPNSGNWWLSFDNIDVGYWPAAIFTHLASYATSVEWGGEIVNREANFGQHTTTDMGSGHFPKEGYGKASYFRNVEIVDSTNALVPPQSVSKYESNPYCYKIQINDNATWGFHFFYGGPGRNPNCL